MAEKTNIEWCDHTGSPWLGCSIVSCGCSHCYAKCLAETRLEGIFRRAYKKAGLENWETRPVWGDKATRVLTKGFWREARVLDRKAAADGIRRRMFPSLIDWLDQMPAGIIDQDGQVLSPKGVRADFLKLIRDTPHLDWLLLTKRPENWSKLILESEACCARNGIRDDEQLFGHLHDWLIKGEPPANVWIGTTVEDQARADERIPHLLSIPARVRFLSCEPLLRAVNLDVYGYDVGSDPCWPEGIHWVICGGESGKEARPMHPDWARSLRDQCQAAGVPFLFKQWGEWQAAEVLTATRSRTVTAVGAARPPLHVARHDWFDGARSLRVGKYAAGRLLDGVEHNGFPEVSAV